MSRKTILLASAMACVITGQIIISCWFEYQREKERNQQSTTQMVTEDEVAED
ncbi:MAG: hypothetical protein HY219_02650 [Candidatus Staskawiczbacteria bacterium]|nr:hypothetical protein [Candidatus Staskawiczbacteria bacterium]